MDTHHRMILESLYASLMNTFIGKINDYRTRNDVVKYSREYLEQYLPDVDFTFKCDHENNTYLVIDSNQLIIEADYENEDGKLVNTVIILK